MSSTIHALVDCCLAGDIEKVEYLVRPEGVDVNKGNDKYTPLTAASLGGHVGVVEILIKHKADLDLRDPDGFAPLHRAAASGHYYITELLLKSGAEPGSRDSREKTPLMWASQREQPDIVKLLHTYKADINAQNTQGVTALMYAAVSGSKKCLDVLLRIGADVNIESKGGCNAINQACSQDQAECLEILIPCLDINQLNTTGVPALGYAARFGSVSCADKLIAAGCDMETKNVGGRTPLMTASRRGVKHIIELLLENGALVNSQTGGGETALHLVCQQLEFEVTADIPAPDFLGSGQLLLEHGADLHIKDNEGKTALDVAIERGQAEIVSILQHWKPPVSTKRPESHKPPRTPAALPPPDPTPDKSPLPSKPCKIYNHAKDFLKQLNLSDAYFNGDYDNCFCPTCHSARGDNFYYSRGTPGKDYGLPIGWCKFGLKAPAKAFAENTFQDWHMAFNGTLVESVPKILATGELLIPGDYTPDGHQLSIPNNHWDPNNPHLKPPRGHDVRKIYLSPSIHYSGCDVYAPLFRWMDTGVRVAFQVRIKPDSYDVTDQTIGATGQIDPKIPNSQLEWSTKRRGVTILVGLLVKMEGDVSSKELGIFKQKASDAPTLPQEGLLPGGFSTLSLDRKSTTPVSGSMIEITADYVFSGPKGDNIGFKSGATYRIARSTEEGYWVRVKTKIIGPLSKTTHALVPFKHAKLL